MNDGRRPRRLRRGGLRARKLELLGWALAAEGDPEGEEMLVEAIRLGNEEARRKFGILLATKPGREAEAEELLRASGAERERGECFDALVAVLDRQKRFDDAEALARPFAESGDGYALDLLGRTIELQGGRSAEAEKAYRAAIASGRDTAMVHLGGLVESAGRDEEALSLYEAAGKAGVSFARERLGPLLCRTPGRFEDGFARCAEVAADADAEAAQRLIHAGVRAWDDGRHEDAERLLLLLANRGNAVALRLLGVLIHEVDASRLAEAEALLGRAIELGDMDAYSCLAEMLSKYPPRRGDAVRLCEDAIDAGDDCEAPTLLAQLLGKDDPQQGERIQELLRLATSAGHESAPAYLARRLWAEDRRDELEFLYRTAIERGHGPAPAVELACFLREESPSREAEAIELVVSALQAPIRTEVLRSVVFQGVIDPEAAVWAMRQALAWAEAELRDGSASADLEGYHEELTQILTDLLSAHPDAEGKRQGD